MAHDPAEEAVQRVLTRDVSSIFPVHRSLPSCRAAERRHRAARHIVRDIAALSDAVHRVFTQTETFCSRVIHVCAGWCAGQESRMQRFRVISRACWVAAEQLTCMAAKRTHMAEATGISFHPYDAWHSWHLQPRPYL